SPITNTVGSRRSSSASASLTACAVVISRPRATTLGALAELGEDIFGDLTRVGEWRGERELHTALDHRSRLGLDRPERLLVGEPLLDEPVRVQHERVTLGQPELLFVLRAIV